MKHKKILNGGIFRDLLLDSCPNRMATEKGSVKILNQEVFFTELISSISVAKNSISLEFFTVESRGISEEILNLLKTKSNQGVNVKLIIDWVGCNVLNVEKQKDGTTKQLSLSEEFLNRYRSENFEIIYYNPLPRILPRTHQKLVIIDERIAFVGGMNLIEGYRIGIEGRNGYAYYTDKMLKIEGPIVKNLSSVFADIYRESAHKALDKSKNHVTLFDFGAASIGVVTTCGHSYRPYFEEVLVDMFNMAKKEVLIRSPYIVLTKKVKRAIKSAIDRGVIVTFLTGAESDMSVFVEKILCYMASQVEKLGARLIRNPGFFHHDKCIIVDKEFVFTGSHNTDIISFWLQHELSLVIYDKAVVDRFVVDFESCLIHAKEVTATNKF